MKEAVQKIGSDWSLALDDFQLYRKKQTTAIILPYAVPIHLYWLEYYSIHTE